MRYTNSLNWFYLDVKFNVRAEPKPGSDNLKVDPNSGHTDEILVLYDDQNGYTAYNSMLNIFDITTRGNKFYQIQVIKERNAKNYWL
jgi:hypothetical protein